MSKSQQHKVNTFEKKVLPPLDNCPFLLPFDLRVTPFLQSQHSHTPLGADGEGIHDDDLYE